MTEDRPKVREGTRYVATIPAGWSIRMSNGALFGFSPDKRPHVLTCHAEVGKLETRWSWEPIDLAPEPPRG